MILPVLREMTIVAAVNSPDKMAREEVRTVIEGCCVVDMAVVCFVAERKSTIFGTQED